MTPDELNDAIIYLGTIFEKWKTPTGDELAVWKRKIAPYSLEKFRQAALEHKVLRRVQTTSPCLPDILDIARRSDPSAVTPKHEAKRAVQYLREEFPERFTGKSDVEAIIEHTTACYADLVRHVRPGRGREFARAVILAQARNALEQIGWSRGDATELARECVGLNPGERLGFAATPEGLPSPEIAKEV